VIASRSGRACVVKGWRKREAVVGKCHRNALYPDANCAAYKVHCSVANKRLAVHVGNVQLGRERVPHCDDALPHLKAHGAEAGRALVNHRIGERVVERILSRD
jgi:hypothetical protein